MPKKARKKYTKPRKPFDKQRIQEENELRKRYGLKSKREIWKAEAEVGKIRNLAKELITKSEEEKNSFIERLRKKGYNVNSLQDALALDKEDLLKRRLQTIVFVKSLARTPSQARQLIAHKHVVVGNRTVNIPSYHVSLEDEAQISLNIALKLPEAEKSKIESVKEEIENEVNEIEEALLE